MAGQGRSGPPSRHPTTGRRERPAWQRNAANPRQRDWAERREREREEGFISSLRAVMMTPEGRRTFGELLDRAGLWRTSYDASGSATYFNEGKRNFGLEIRDYLETASEDLYLEMEREMRAVRRSLEREAAAVQQQSTPADETEGER